MSRRLVIVCAVLGIGALALYLGRREGSRRGGSSSEAIESAESTSLATHGQNELSAVDAERAVAPRERAALDTEEPERAAVDTPPRPIVLAGIVVDVAPGENGARTPVAGVKVAGQRGFFGDVDLPAVVTDELGRFRIELADSGKRPLSFQLWCDPGEQHRAGTTRVKLVEGAFDALELVLERFPTGDLVGTTVDPDGDAVPHARVELRDRGTATRESTSDEKGGFRFENVQPFDELVAERDGYVLLEAKRPREREKGGWDDARVVLAPAGSLRVAVRDARGEPLAETEIVARVSAIERHGPRRHEFGDTSRADVKATTDASGVAVLESVWAEQRLELELRTAEAREAHRPLVFRRHEDGVLASGDSNTGRAIVVAAGSELALVAHVAAAMRVTGRVEDASGNPVANAAVSIEPVEQRYAALTSANTGDDGRFSLSFPSREARARVRLFAYYPEVFGPPKPDARCTVKVVDLAAGEPAEVALVLPDAQNIEGRVLDSDGKGVRGVVYAYENADPPLLGRARQAHVAKDGTFVIGMLVPGTYDLRAQASDRFADRWLRGVAAGTRGIEFRLDEERRARVTVEVALRGGAEAEQIVVLRRRFDPSAKVPPDAMPLAESAQYSDPVGWPRDVVTLWSGGGGDYTLTPMKTNPTVLALDEGCYWLGAKARDKDGRHYFPIATGLVRIDAGERRLRFELTLAARVEGRVHASDALDLAVGIAWKEGQLLELDAGVGDLVPYRELGADGAFTFQQVPVGEHELWVGTPDELRAGTPQRKQKLVVGRESVTSVEVTLGG